MKREFKLKGYVRAVPFVGAGLGVKRRHTSIDMLIIIPFVEIELSLILKNSRHEI